MGRELAVRAQRALNGFDGPNCAHLPPVPAHESGVSTKVQELFDFL